MPFPVGHGLIGASLYSAVREEISFRRDGKFLLLCAGLAIIPDFDFVFAWFFNLRGWHRGFTHSLVFGAGLGFLAAYLTSIRTLRHKLGLMLASMSHAPLDALVTTNLGTGVALLWPITSYRFHFGLFDYFPFQLDPRFDPWIDIFIHVLKVSLVELVVAGPLLLVAVLLKR